MDDNTGHGGARSGSGRKPKIDELRLIEKLTPMEEDALKQLEKGVRSGDYRFIALYMSYLYGKPKDSLDVTTNGETITPPSIVFTKRD